MRGQIDDPMPGYAFGQQALFAAVQRSDRETIEVMLRAGADIRKRTEWWAGGFGVLDDCDPSMVEFLMERGALMDAHAAARLGKMEELRELVANDRKRGARSRGRRANAAAFCLDNRGG